ncbi:MAG: amidohydrolase, partial [Mycobacterium sp.]
MRIVALEEHFATKQFFEGPGREHFERMASGSQRFPGGAGRLAERLSDVASGRIAEMDAAGIDVQVLSLTAPGLEQVPGSDAVALARAINDDLAAAIGDHPQRLAGFAALPTADPA